MIETYKAIVTTNQDDEQRGRIKIACADLLGDFTVEVPVWVEPRYDWGWFIVPDIGEMVDINVTVENNNDMVKGQVSIDAPDINWNGARYYSPNEIGEKPTAVNDLFKTNYGKRRGFCTPYGHIILFDDTKGDSQIYISAVVEKHDPVSGELVDTALTNQIVLDKNGIKFSMLDKYTMQMSPEGKLTLQLDGDNSLEIDKSGSSTTMQVGDGAKHVPLVEPLEALWGTLHSWIIAHTHPTGMGPSGPPTEAATAPEWDTAINSTKVSVPDG